MTLSFIEALDRELNTIETTNGASYYKSTYDSNLDLFGTIGTMRNYDYDNIIRMFSDAYTEDPLTAIRMAFYARDVRGGLGERQTFRTILRWLGNNAPDDLRSNVKWIPYFGRWDDLYSLVDTPLEDEVIKVMQKEDEVNGYNSLMWKWLKSPNTSNAESVRMGRWTAINVFHDTNSKNHFPVYRKKLKKGRAEIGVVEALMSANKWSQINYNSLTSYNNIRYFGAFLERDSERYTDYLLNADSVNGSVLFPYDIIKKVKKLLYEEGGGSKRAALETKLYDKLWESLPDYQVDSRDSTIAVVDTSGSMECFYSNDASETTPMDVAVSLGMYFADKARGEFKDTFITFSERPSLQKVNGVNIVDKYRKVLDSDWGMNTNLESVFDLILETSINANMKDEDVPKRILIMSDMQFDSCTNPMDSNMFSFENSEKSRTKAKYSFIDNMKEKFSNAGYTFPQLVFWNVGAEGGFHMTADENGFVLISGASQNGFKAVLAGETEEIELIEDSLSGEQSEVVTRTLDPIKAMEKTVHSERYSIIEI